MKKERTIRLHALREGDEVFHDSRWWLVGKPLSNLAVSGRMTFEIKRGSKTAKLSDHMNSVVRIMRTAPTKAENGKSDKG